MRPMYDCGRNLATHPFCSSTSRCPPSSCSTSRCSARSTGASRGRGTASTTPPPSSSPASTFFLQKSSAACRRRTVEDQIRARGGWRRKDLGETRLSVPADRRGALGVRRRHASRYPKKKRARLASTCWRRRSRCWGYGRSTTSSTCTTRSTSPSSSRRSSA